MSDWQHEHKTVLGRDMYILDNEMYTDVTFSMSGEREGEQQLVEVKCHRVYLAKSSPVFSAMFYGDMKKLDLEEVIFLPDVNEHAFKAMLTYIYTGEVNLSKYKYEVVCGLLYLSKKYLLHESLLEQVYSHLWHHMYPGNVWTVLHFAESNDEPQLEETAWKVIELKTSECLVLENFQEAKVTWLQKLTAKDDLKCREINLFNAVLGWAASEAVRQGRDPDPLTLRDILSPILPHIRFLTMTGREFVYDVMNTGLFTNEEMLQIVANLLVPNSRNHPEHICVNTEIRIGIAPNVKDFFAFATPKSESTFKRDYYCLPRGDYIDLIKMTTSVFVNRSILARSGVQIVRINFPTQISDTNDEEQYEENLTIILFDEQTKKIFHTESFCSLVKYNSEHDIIFSPPLSLASVSVNRDNYQCIGASVVFHKSGRYPRYIIYVTTERLIRVLD